MSSTLYLVVVEDLTLESQDQERPLWWAGQHGPWSPKQEICLAPQKLQNSRADSGCGPALRI